jgi:hypothetical protein
MHLKRVGAWTHRQTNTETKRHSQTHTDINRQTQTQTQRHTDADTYTHRQRRNLDARFGKGVNILADGMDDNGQVVKLQRAPPKDRVVLNPHQPLSLALLVGE